MDQLTTILSQLENTDIPRPLSCKIGTELCLNWLKRLFVYISDRLLQILQRGVLKIGISYMIYDEFTGYLID